jgi:transposase-like protein
VGQLEPEVVRLLTKDIALSLTFYQFDVRLHPLVRSTNLLERFFREFRTKADEIGSFPNAVCAQVSGPTAWRSAGGWNEPHR